MTKFIVDTIEQCHNFEINYVILKEYHKVLRSKNNQPEKRVNAKEYGVE